MNRNFTKLSGQYQCFTLNLYDALHLDLELYLNHDPYRLQNAINKLIRFNLRVGSAFPVPLVLPSADGAIVAGA